MEFLEIISNFFVGTFLFLVEQAPLLSGFLLPPFVEILNKDVPDKNERFLVALLVSFVVAAFLQWKLLVGGQPEQIALWLGLVFTESQIVYRLYFKNSAAREKIQETLGAKREEPEEPFTP